MRLKRIHVSQHAIRANAKHGFANEAPLRAKVGRENIAGHEVVPGGTSRVVYRPEKPLSCGARVWIETAGAVEVVRDGRTVRVVE